METFNSLAHLDPEILGTINHADYTIGSEFAVWKTRKLGEWCFLAP